MNKKDMHRICHKAIELWGKNLQTMVCMEEMAELIQALSKNIRGARNEINIAEEIADVEIMLEQLKQMFNLRYAVENYQTKKLKRLEKRIEREPEKRKS